MAFVPGAEYDVFLSYARIDNEATPGRWVSEFHVHLLSSLKQALGSPQVRIFVDFAFGNNQQLGEILSAARKSAVFLALGSRAWVQREWTVREVEEFTRAHSDPSRRFAVELKPLLSGQVYPPELRDHNRRPLYWPLDGVGQITLVLSTEYERDRYYAEVHNLAEQIAVRLMALKSELVLVEPPCPALLSVDPTIPPTGRPVVVALAEDMDRRSGELASYLRQFGITVRDAGEHGRGAPDFTGAFEDDLNNCEIFAQVLGSGARAPRDLPEGFAHHQLRRARECGLEILQWRSPNLDVDDLDDPDHKALLVGENVICSSFEDFKARVRDRAFAPPPAIAVSGELRHDVVVFIDANDLDRQYALAIQKAFLDADFVASIPERNRVDTATSFLAAQQEMLLDCDVLVFIYGCAEPEWVSAQLRLFTRVRKGLKPPRVAAIYHGPPHPKETLSTRLPRIRELNGGEGWEMAPIHDLIAELKG